MESDGFRPRRSANDGIRKSQAKITEGYKYMVDMALEKYFYIVNQSKLKYVLSRTIKDGKVISLIHKYLQVRVIVKHKLEKTPFGVPEGGPLSPFHRIIMLNELDIELERRGHRFVGYVDDMIILCKSKRSSKRTLEHILSFKEEKHLYKLIRRKL